ncbi:hypothetical protein D3C86_1731090 [compost metagenome]
MPMQFCPAAQKAPDTQDSTVGSISQSSSTRTGAFPPRSIASFFNPALRAMASPVAKPPVKEIIRTSRISTKALPKSTPPVAGVITEGGRPAFTKHSTSLRADNGASSEGFKITALPPAIAGPSLWATKFSGSL